MSCRKPAMQTRSAPAWRQASKIRRLNSSTEPASFRSTTVVSMPAWRARSKANASRLFETTRTTWAGISPFAERSMKFCKVVPLPLTSTARRRGLPLIQVLSVWLHVEDPLGILAQQQPRQGDGLLLAVSSRSHEVIRQYTSQNAPVHVVFRQDELELVGVAVIAD